MWEVLLTLCAAAGAPDCETRRLPGGETRAACAATAQAVTAAADGFALDWPCVPAGETPAFPVTEIAPGVFVHRGAIALADRTNRGDIANLGFVIGAESVAVIDAGGSPAVARDLLAAIRARTALPVRWLILTHAHPDHILGARVFAEAGATVIGHHALPRAMAQRGPAYVSAAERQTGARLGPEALVAIDETVETVREIDLGGRVLRLEAHPEAHSGADLTVRDLATDSWFLGDLLFLRHFPSLDGSVAGWIAVLDGLAARPAARAVPGHGPVAVAWPGGAAALRAYLDGLAAAARAAIAAGTPTLAASRRIAAESPEDWRLRDAFAERNAVGAIRELEWE